MGEAGMPNWDSNVLGMESLRLPNGPVKYFFASSLSPQDGKSLSAFPARLFLACLVLNRQNICVTLSQSKQEVSICEHAPSPLDQIHEFLADTLARFFQAVIYCRKRRDQPD
jgi:hypothetical protein